MKKIIFISVVLVVLTLILIRTIPRSGHEQMELSILDIGQGDSIVVRTPDHVTIVIDASAGHQVVDALASVLPWNQRRIDYLLLTHPDLDHYGGARWLLERYDIGRVLYNGDEIHGSQAFQQLLVDIRRREIPLDSVSAGQVMRWPSGVRWTFLWPPQGYAAPSTNAGCVATKLSWGTQDIMIPCDLPSEQESLVINLFDDVSAEILKVGHHGSRYSSSQQWLQAVKPRWCVISAGARNRYSHPNEATILRLRTVGCKLVSTIDSGTIQFHLSSTSTEYLPPSRGSFFGLPIASLLAILNPLDN